MRHSLHLTLALHSRPIRDMQCVGYSISGHPSGQILSSDLPFQDSLQYYIFGQLYRLELQLNKLYIFSQSPFTIASSCQRVAKDYRELAQPHVNRFGVKNWSRTVIRRTQRAPPVQKSLLEKLFHYYGRSTWEKAYLSYIWVRSVPIKDYQQETVWAFRGKNSTLLRLCSKPSYFAFISLEKSCNSSCTKSCSQKKLHLHLSLILSKIFACALPK